MHIRIRRTDLTANPHSVLEVCALGADGCTPQDVRNIRACKESSVQSGSTKVGFIEGGANKDCVRQCCSTKVGPIEIGICEISAGAIYAAQVRLAQIDVLEVKSLR